MLQLGGNEGIVPVMSSGKIETELVTCDWSQVTCDRDYVTRQLDRLNFYGKVKIFYLFQALAYHACSSTYGDEDQQSRKEVELWTVVRLVKRTQTCVMAKVMAQAMAWDTGRARCCSSNKCQNSPDDVHEIPIWGILGSYSLFLAEKEFVPEYHGITVTVLPGPRVPRLPWLTALDRDMAAMILQRSTMRREAEHC